MVMCAVRTHQKVAYEVRTHQEVAYEVRTHQKVAYEVQTHQKVVYGVQKYHKINRERLLRMAIGQCTVCSPMKRVLGIFAQFDEPCL